MSQSQIVGQTTLEGALPCRVCFHRQTDTVDVQVGCTTLCMPAQQFIVIQEMLRKAAARIVMQTEVAAIEPRYEAGRG